MKREKMGFIDKQNDGSELINYDDPGFPTYIYNGWIAPKVTWANVPHYHEDIEILTVTEGRMYYNVNGKDLLLLKGDTIVVNSNFIHYSKCYEDEVAKYVIFIANPSILSNSPIVETNAIRPITDNPEIDYFRFRSINENTEAIRDLVLGLPEIRHDAFAITKQFYQIWDILRKQADAYGINTKEQVSDSRMQSFKTMMSFVSANYRSKLTLDDIALSGNVSKSLCNKLFHLYVGESPISYLLHIRSRKVSELLRSGNLSMTDIAEKTGFSGVSYMSETFRKFYGKSPREYKKEL